MKVFGYTCLVARGLSLQDQEETLLRFCREGGHRLLGIFTDQHSSPGRPQYEALLDCLQNTPGGFLVVCAGSQYLGDTLRESLVRILDLEGSERAKLVCADEDVPHPLHSALKYWTRAEPSLSRGERIREAMKAKAVHGNGLGKPPYGYGIGLDGKLAVKSKEAEVVQLIFRLYAEEGRGIRTVTRILNEGGTRTRRGHPWSMVTIRDILMNRTYLGTYARFGIVVPGSHTPLISRELFRTAQELRKSRGRLRHTSRGEPFLLTGLVRCSSCGNRMLGVRRKQAWRRKDGYNMERLYRYYQCQSRTNHSLCSFHTWRAGTLEMEVQRQLTEAVHTGTVHLTALARLGTPSQMDSVAVASKEHHILKVLGKVVRENLPIKKLSLALAEQEYSTLVSGNPVVADFTGIRNPPELELAWSSLPLERLRQLLAHLIDRVDVTDSTVTVSFV